MTLSDDGTTAEVSRFFRHAPSIAGVLVLGGRASLSEGEFVGAGVGVCVGGSPEDAVLLGDRVLFHTSGILEVDGDGACTSGK